MNELEQAAQRVEKLAAEATPGLWRDIAPHLAELLRDSVDDEGVPHPAAVALARALRGKTA